MLWNAKEIYGMLEIEMECCRMLRNAMECSEKMAKSLRNAKEHYELMLRNATECYVMLRNVKLEANARG